MTMYNVKVPIVDLIESDSPAGAIEYLLDQLGESGFTVHLGDDPQVFESNIPALSRIIYGVTDVASELGLSTPAVSNHLARHDDTPVPAYETPRGQKFWTASGMNAWRRWYDERNDR